MWKLPINWHIIVHFYSANSYSDIFLCLVEIAETLGTVLFSQISDQLQSRFSSEVSLPQICENFMKATYDPRISGVYFHIEPLHC